MKKVFFFEINNKKKKKFKERFSLFHSLVCSSLGVYKKNLLKTKQKNQKRGKKKLFHFLIYIKNGKHIHWILLYFAVGITILLVRIKDFF